MFVNYFRNIFRFITISVLFFNFSSGFAQCAGTGSEITICDKETDLNFQIFELFPHLTAAIPGGTWIAESNFDSVALDPTTGIVNLWKINRFGIHQFTYTNPSCDSSSSTVTINLGGYPGEDNQDVDNVCDDLVVSLFEFIDTPSALIRPDLGGTWEEDPSNPVLGVLGDDMFDPTSKPLGIYTFTYTVPDVNGCSERTATVDVEIHRTPQPGTPLNIELCETDDMSGLTAVNLFSRLDGADSNGEWTDINTFTTGEISSGTDFEINVENIYNNFGSGTYEFKYKVIPEHPICDADSTTFTICIQKRYDLKGTVSVACDGKVTLLYDKDLLDDGFYSISYTVTGSQLGTHINTKSTSFLEGMAQFDLFPELVINTSETLTIQIDDVGRAPSCGTEPLCIPTIDVPSEKFDMFRAPIISVSSSSGCELDDILITYQGAEDSSFALLNGTTAVAYSINGVNYTDEVTFANGNAIASVPSNRFNQDNNSLVFFNTNSFIHCKDIPKATILNLIPAPPNPIFDIIPDDRCDAKELQYIFDGTPDVAFDTFNVTFDMYLYGTEPAQFSLRDVNTSLPNNTQSIGDYSANNSDISSYPDGDYVFVIRSEQTDNTPCRGLSQAEIDDYASRGIDIGLTKVGTKHIFDARMNFRIGPPEPAVLVKNAFEVCLLNDPVILSDLSLYAGQDVDVTITDLVGAELPDTYEITQNGTFVVVLNSAITGCFIGTEQFIVTVVSEASIPVLNDNVFCSSVTSTVADLDVSSQDIIWYDAATNGMAYNGTDVIDTNNQYWAEITISGGCVSTTRAQAVIIPVAMASTPVPLENEFCSVETPTISDLNVESDPSATLQWYVSETGDPYPSTALPLDNTKEYWVTQTIQAGCESDRVQVTFIINDVAMSPVPLDNAYCYSGSSTLTLDDLQYTDASISNQGVLSYFSDSIGNTSIASSELLQNVASPIYVQQVIAGTCSSNIVAVNFTLQSIAPDPNISAVVICLENSPTIQDLKDKLESQTSTELTLYEDEITPTLLDLNSQLETYTGAVFVSQTIAGNCESNRVQATYTLSEVPSNPVPLDNFFCYLDNPAITVGDLQYTSASISSQGNLTYFSDPDGTIAISSSELLENVISPVYVQQDFTATCFSDVVAVNFTLQQVPKPNISPVALCLVNNPTIQDLINALESQTSTDITIYQDEITTTAMDVNTVLETLAADIFASQTSMEGCESSERELVVFSLEDPILSASDFAQVLCSSEQATLNDAYLGVGTVLWYDAANAPILDPGSEIVQNGVSYFAQLDISGCLSPSFEVIVSLINVSDPVGSLSAYEFCGITEKYISDLTSEMNFTTPADHTLIWYNSNNASTRTPLYDDAVLQQGIYYAVYEVEDGNYICESNAFPVSVNVTACTTEQLFIPDAFSPNDDSINDTFELLNIGFVFPDYEIEIYNRYGRLVFKGNNEVGFWDGKNNQSGFLSNEVLPTGIYFYVINFNRFDKEPYQGQVYLKR